MLNQGKRFVAVMALDTGDDRLRIMRAVLRLLTKLCVAEGKHRTIRTYLAKYYLGQCATFDFVCRDSLGSLVCAVRIADGKHRTVEDLPEKFTIRIGLF